MQEPKEPLSLSLARERANFVLHCLSFAFLAPCRGCATPKGSAKDDGRFLLLFAPLYCSRQTRRLILRNILPSGRFTKRDSRSYICNYNLI